MLHPWRIIRPVFSPSTVKWAFGCRTTAPTVTRQAAWRPSVPAVNAFRAESGVPPPVKSWLQTADENPVFTALLPAQSACGGIKWWWPTKHLWRGCKRDSFAHTHTRAVVHLYDPTMATWTGSEPVWLTRCRSDSCLCPRCAVSERKGVMTKTFRRTALGCFHACMCFMRTRVHACMATAQSSALCMCLSAGFSFLSFWGSEKKKKKSIRGGCQIRIRAALLIRWKTSHAPRFWMERHSLTCLFPLIFAGTFPQNCSIFVVVNLVKNHLSCVADSSISNTCQGYTERKAESMRPCF